MKVWPLVRRRRVVPSAAIVATVVAMAEAAVAMVSDRSVTSRTSSLFQAIGYQRKEKPSQIAMLSPALKE